MTTRHPGEDAAQPDMQELHQEKVSPTAAYVAMMKSIGIRSDVLPWSEKIAKAGGADEMFDKWRAANGIEGYPKLFSRGMAARHLMIDHVLRSRKIKNILDVGMGLPTRGLTFTENIDTVYVGVDFPVVIAQDRAILNKIAESEPGVKSKSNLRYRQGDITKGDTLAIAANDLDADGPTAVITEGVISYLNREQLRDAATNMAAIMKTRPGTIWITDLVTRGSFAKFRESANAIGDIASVKMLDKFSEIIGQNIDEAPLENEQDAEAFFIDLGFSIEKLDHSPIADQLDNQRLGFSSEETREAMSRRGLWVLSIANAAA